MAKHVILENYTFTPSTKTIVVNGKNIRREQLLLITNTTDGIVLYNFSDPSLSATSYVNSVDSTTGQETTTIVLAYNTTSMNSDDKLSIIVEETYTEIIPSEALRDPVEKLRVSQPQSLIDTDFEYGVQPTKWETLNLLNNRPTAFYDPTTPLNVTAMSVSTKVVTVSCTTPPAVGTPIFVTGTLDPAYADGWWLVESVVAGTSFTFSVTTAPAATLFDNNKTYIYAGSFFTGSAIPTATTGFVTLNGSTATVTTTSAHGLQVGNGIYMVGTTNAAGPLNARTTFSATSGTSGAAFGTYTGVAQKSTSGTGTGGTFTVITTAASTAYTSSVSSIVFVAAGSNYKVGDTVTLDGANLGGTTVTNDLTFTIGGITGLLNSSWVVATTPSNTTFTFACTATGTPTGLLNATLFPRPLGYSVHRSFDGGVQFSNVSPYQGYQVIRQTRRYFRYQSGKGIQFSTGSILKPTVNVNTITASGTTVTVTCKYPHGMMPGAVVKVSGCTETAYNGTFTVATAATPLTFTYTALSTPSASPATGTPAVGPFSWYGASNRIGMFDSQNGFYFEYDGQTLYAVRRSSTYQLSGLAAVTNGSQSVVGTSTKFSSQLKAGDWVVIRGQSYLVQQITSDTQMYICPEYRGTTSTSCQVTKTINTKYPQSSWNIDKCDGTGASQFNLDLTKMQMFYADYTWYGAGAIRFGFKNNRGEVVYCHRIPNNNVNTEAYMRSGNLPARYETNTLPPWTYLTATLSSATTTGGIISVADTTGWPSSGTVIITQAAATGALIEYITYSAKTATTLTIAARAQTGGSTATTFTYSATAPIQVELYSPQNASTISHWGSSVIMDGRYDDDRSFLFNYGTNTPITYSNQGQRYPVFSIRLAPSVDNGLTGLLGAREVINRMQLSLEGIGVYTLSAGVRVELILNGRVSGGTFAPVGGSSLAQYATHTNAHTISGGESILTFFAPAGGVSSQDLSKVRDLGNSILGGGTSLTVPNTTANVYPDGPDIVTVCITPLASNASVAARLNWTEAQA